MEYYRAHMEYLTINVSKKHYYVNITRKPLPGNHYQELVQNLSSLSGCHTDVGEYVRVMI